MTTTTVYPSLDNTVLRSSADSTWADITGGAGTGTGGATWTWDWAIRIKAGTTTDRWSLIHRGIFVFDTSALPDTDVISSATLSINGYGSADPATAIAHDSNIYVAGASGTDDLIQSGDYELVGSTALSTAITYASWSTSYNDYILNASGLANISKTGYSRFCLMNENYDADAVGPTWSSATVHDLNTDMADALGTSSDPKLVIEHAAPTFIPRMIVF